MADSKEYWAERAKKLEKRAYEKGEKLNKKLLREYRKASQEITQKLEAFYGRYAAEQGISYAEAVKKLDSREARKWKKTLGQYVEEINALPDGPEKDKLVAELDARSYASQQDRLSELKGQVDMEIDRLFASTERQTRETMTDVLEDGYYRKGFDLQQRAGVISPFARLNTDMVERVLTYPWSGADFSARIWENKRTLLFRTRQVITQGIIQGHSVARMSNDLADEMGKSYRTAERLIRTETAHFHAEADVMAYEAAGVEEYEFMAGLDFRTCEVCGALDGKHFPLSEAKTGVNYPPIHPNCRCTTVEYDPEEAADWDATGEPMPERMTYEEWKAEQDALHGEGYVDIQRKKEYNYSADLEQYKKYKELLGKKDNLRSIETFQNLKYNDPNGYAALKTSYADKRIQNRLQSNPAYTTLKTGQQGKHIIGHNNYIAGRSYLTVSMDEAQELIKQYVGTGKLKRDKKGRWTHKEFVTVDRVIGYIVPSDGGDPIPTRRFSINYATGKSKGAHMVPAKEE